MSRWANDPGALERISNISRQLVSLAIVEATLDSGIVLEGAVRNISVGNNASSALQNGHWLYYGNFDIEMLDGQRLNIDMCDVKLIRNMWQERKEAYEDARLIKIVR